MEKTKTIDIIKEKRTVPEHVKQRMKTFNKIKKTIKNSLKEGQKTIPEIAEATELPQDVVTYNLMTLIKYGDIIAGEIDEDDEYFYYKLK